MAVVVAIVGGTLVSFSDGDRQMTPESLLAIFDAPCVQKKAESNDPSNKGPRRGGTLGSSSMQLVVVAGLGAGESKRQATPQNEGAGSSASRASPEADRNRSRKLGI